jgi:hypothetical protein
VLNLPSDEIVLLNMPLGYPTASAFYNFKCVTPPGSAALPEVKQSALFLDTALAEATESHKWGNEVPITPQMTSQILWSAYGVSYLKDMTENRQHQATASAGGTYPLEFWMMNSTGTYLYDPWGHTIYTMSLGDNRIELAKTTGNPWMASSPMTLLAVINTSKLYSDPVWAAQALPWAFTEIGCAIQNVFLESAPQGLVADWAKILDENATKTMLGIAQYPDLSPVIAITVGHTIPGDINGDGVVDILDAIKLSLAFGLTLTSPRWNPYADLNSDGVVNILDAIILANHFGKTT